MSSLEDKYVLEGGQYVLFKLVDEATGFGNRPSARPLRQRIHNLINMYDDCRIIINFEGVSVVSASFADELVARLAKEVGVATFF